MSQRKYTLYEMRKMSGIPPASVARQIGASYQSLRNWEKGVSVPNVVYVYALLKLYGFTLNELKMDDYIDKVVKNIPKEQLIYSE